MPEVWRANWRYSRAIWHIALVTIAILNVNIRNKLISQMKRQSPAPVPARTTGTASFSFGKTFPFLRSLSECQFVINFKPVAGNCPHCDYPLLIEKETAQGMKRFCASKQCESRFRRMKSVNNNLPTQDHCARSEGPEK